MNSAKITSLILLAFCAFVSLNLKSFIEVQTQRSELASDQHGSDQVTILNDKLSKVGVNTGDDWKVDESVPLGELNPSIPSFHSAGRSSSSNVTVKPSARPAEDKGENYGDVLQRSGVNTGEVNSQWNRRFAAADGLEPSYSIGPTPNREQESFGGMVDDVLSGKDNGGTVKKALQTFDSALTQFSRAEGSSLSMVRSTSRALAPRAKVSLPLIVAFLQIELDARFFAGRCSRVLLRQAIAAACRCS